MNMIFSFLIGLGTGILSGFGIGGGSLLILYLTIVLGIDQYTAAGINLLYFLCCAPAALVSHNKNHLIDKKTALICIIAGILSSVLAAFLASVISLRLLRRAFGIFLLYVGFNELFCKSKPCKESTQPKEN